LYEKKGAGVGGVTPSSSPPPYFPAYPWEFNLKKMVENFYEKMKIFFCFSV
jgi:hypothetical protein